MSTNNMFSWKNKKNIYLIPTLSRSMDLKVLFSIQKVLIFFLFLHENICCGYSLEVPQRGTYNEYQQHVFVEKLVPTTYVFVEK